MSSSSNFSRASKKQKQRRWTRLLENYEGLPPPEPDDVPSDVLQRDYDEFGPDGIECLAEHWFVCSELARRLQTFFVFRSMIKNTYHAGNAVLNFYNFRLEAAVFSTLEVQELMANVLTRRSGAVKVQASFGVLLQHSETNEYRYFWSSDK